MAPVVYSVLEIQWIVLSESELSSSPATNSLLFWTSVFLSLRGFEHIVFTVPAKVYIYDFLVQGNLWPVLQDWWTQEQGFSEKMGSASIPYFFLDAKINKKFP